MNLPSSSVPRRAPGFRHVASVWLLALSAGLVVVMLDVIRLGAAPEPSPQLGQVDALSARLGRAEQQLAAIKLQTPSLTQEALVTARAELDARLAQVETELRGHTDDQALQALQGRIEKLEVRPAPTKAVIPPLRSKSSSTKPTKASPPPFQVMGVELRGGEMFLTVAPLGATTVGQMRLLRAGEAQGSWMLESIGVKQATFRVEGKLQQLVVP
ncbi:Methyl-accepting chemotaxis protein [Pseudomonas chlororaphis subsp. aureofaciens]|uniref:hypothetical protein n=1 Tax=Pseudomonas chlororaphis TaxID=587753 RepID=UPI000F56579D|nr:hypothetical protein [Pseudomonas chlororaphis]AZD86839.1 Methyl-accepting chemotaxis protein [Pseudomonas chlororaphis subsp. aureofaciens]